MRVFAVSLWLLFVATSAAAQGLFEIPRPTDVAQWSVQVDPDSTTAGSSVALVLRARLEDGWKMYAIGTAAGKPLSVAFPATPVLSPSAPVVQDSVEVGYDPNFDTDVTYFTAGSLLRIPVAVAASAAPGTHALPGRVEFMVCNDRVCLPPTTVPVEGRVVVAQ